MLQKTVGIYCYIKRSSLSLPGKPFIKKERTMKIKLKTLTALSMLFFMSLAQADDQTLKFLLNDINQKLCIDHSENPYFLNKKQEKLLFHVNSAKSDIMPGRYEHQHYFAIDSIRTSSETSYSLNCWMKTKPNENWQAFKVIQYGYSLSLVE